LMTIKRYFYFSPMTFLLTGKNKNGKDIYATHTFHTISTSPPNLPAVTTSGPKQLSTTAKNTSMSDKITKTSTVREKTTSHIILTDPSIQKALSIQHQLRKQTAGPKSK